MVAVLLLLLGAAWFVPYRLRCLFGFKALWMWLGAAGIFGLLMLFGILMRLVAVSNGFLLVLLANFSGLFFIYFVYLFLVLLLVWPMSRALKRFSGWKIAIFCLALPMLVVGIGWLKAQSFKVTRFDIPVKNLSRPVSIMHISDLHLGAQRGENYLKRVIKAIEEHRPDMVLYNGDLADANLSLRPELFVLFQSVRAEQYYTTGNHEFYIDTNRVLKLLKENKATILRNQAVEIHGLQLIGLEYMNGDRATVDAHRVNDLTVEEELPKIPRLAGLPTLLLHHTPRGAEYVARCGIDVMLSGHTHNGQVFPGMFFAAHMFPHVRGLYRIGGMTLLVSQGAGTFGPWMRLGTHNEIQFIRLVPAEL